MNRWHAHCAGRMCWLAPAGGLLAALLGASVGAVLAVVVMAEITRQAVLWEPRQ